MAAQGDGAAWAFERAAELLVSSRYPMGMTGAGVSVESGIPPFRGPGGLWTRGGEPPLDAYQRFLADPKGYWEQRLDAPTEIVQALMRAQPNAGHHAMVALEQLGMLRCLITQNIDTLHRAGDGCIARPTGHAGSPSRLR
jgi:NAD-dependent deacetylase